MSIVDFMFNTKRRRCRLRRKSRNKVMAIRRVAHSKDAVAPVTEMMCIVGYPQGIGSTLRSTFGILSREGRVLNVRFGYDAGGCFRYGSTGAWLAGRGVHRRSQPFVAMAPCSSHSKAVNAGSVRSGAKSLVYSVIRRIIRPIGSSARRR